MGSGPSAQVRAATFVRAAHGRARRIAGVTRMPGGLRAGEGSFARPPNGGVVHSLIPSGSLGVDVPVTDAATATIGLGPLRPAPAGLPDPSIRPPTIGRGRRSVHGRPRHRPARPPRARPADPARRHRRPAERDVPRLAVHGRRSSPTWRSSSRRTGWPTTATARGSSSRTARTARRSTIEDSSRVDPWIVRQAQREAASCTERLAEFSRRDRDRRLSATRPEPRRERRADPIGQSRSPTRHPPRPPPVIQFEGGPAMSHHGYANETPSSTPTGRRRTSTTRTSASSRSTSTPPPTSRATSRAPSAGTGRASCPTAIRRDIASREDFSAAAVASRASARTRRSSCTATTTTGSPPGPTGSSSCTATDDVRILNGGRKYWLDNGLPLTTDVPSYAADRLPAARARLQPARLPRRHPAAARRPEPRARRRPLARPSSTARSSRPRA